jgi:cytochrome c oxidase assembly protein subunit 11
MATNMPQRKQDNKLIFKLMLVVVGMFGFGFALVPLYDVFCDLTGINGKTSSTAALYENIEIDESRLITVEFITRSNTGMPWLFESQTKRIKVHPGQLNQVDFTVQNPSNRTVIGQAVPSVSPGPAALFLNKTECFCFNHQELKPGQQAVLPMKFYVDPQIPDDINYFTVQYTMYDVTSSVQEVAANRG